MIGGRGSGSKARTLAIVLLVTLLLGSAAVGAYAHWVLWQPMDSVVIPIAIAAALLVAGIMALIPAARPQALAPVAIGIGLLVGQGIGPSREALHADNGTMTVVLERPRRVEGTGRTTCQTAPSGADLQLEGSSRLQVREADPRIPPDVDPREFVWVSVRVGDRWRDGPTARSDNAALRITVGGVRADEPEVSYAASDESVFSIEWTNDGGHVVFDRLVLDAVREGDVGQPIDLSGTISWTCSEPPLPPESIAIAEAACEETSYITCRDDLLLAMREAAGFLVAVCEHVEGNGRIVQLERAEDAEAWCSAEGDGSPSRVVTVVELP